MIDRFGELHLEQDTVDRIMKTTAFLSRVALCFALSLIPLTELEYRLYSSRLSFRTSSFRPARPHPNIVILTVEPQEFKSLKSRFASETQDSRGNPWQILPPPTKFTARENRMETLRDWFFWDPNVIRETLRKLLNQNPRQIIVTWAIPSEVADSNSDPATELLTQNPKIFWSAQFNAEGKYIAPSENIAPDRQHGFNNLITDSDGEVRRSHLYRFGYPSLTRLLTTPKKKTSDIRDQPYLINYMGPPGSITRCRLIDWMSGRSSNALCRDLKDKVILLAKESYIPLYQDEFRTPLGPMTRSEILANEIYTKVEGHPIHEAHLIVRFVLTIAIIFVSAFYITSYPVVLSALATSVTGIIVTVFFFQIIFQLFSVYIPAMNMALAVLITYLIFTGYRLAFQENIQWRTLKQAQYLRELDQMKTNFLSLISHDLKTPISKIQAMVDRIRREASAETQIPKHDLKEFLDSIENSNNELKHYINSILNLSKIESQKVILNIKSNDINQIIHKVLKRLKPIAVNKGIILEDSLEPLFSVECDEDLMIQVLTNLIDNAIKYSPPGATVKISSKEEEGYIRVDVEDQGPGISNSQLPLMFRKFSRFQRPMHEQVKGTGLGLYLSKYFIELHGGHIRLHTQEGKGTTFTFTLPLNGSESETILS